MTNLLQKLKLIETIQFQLNTSKEEFIKSFKNNVDESDLGFSDSFFEALTSSKNEYKGTIDRHSFKIRRRRKFFDTNRNMFALAQGEFSEKESQLDLKIEIIGFHKSMKFFYGFILVFYVIFLLGFIFSFSTNEDSIPLIVLPFLLLHAVFMMGIPYFLMRRSVQNMKYELERDFHFWIK